MMTGLPSHPPAPGLGPQSASPVASPVVWPAPHLPTLQPGYLGYWSASGFVATPPKPQLWSAGKTALAVAAAVLIACAVAVGVSTVDNNSSSGGAGVGNRQFGNGQFGGPAGFGRSQNGG